MNGEWGKLVSLGKDFVNLIVPFMLINGCTTYCLGCTS